MDTRSSSIRLAATGISIVVTIVITGYFFLWLMNPATFYYSTWISTLWSRTSSTYFGPSLGGSLLVYVLPWLLISLLGCAYLHLGKKSGMNGKRRWGKWKRPMIIKGLGLVSIVEAFFFFMFVTLLVWNLAMYYRYDVAKVTPAIAAKAKTELWQAKLEKAALYFGIVGNLPLALLFFPVTRGSSILPLFGLTSESSIKYHIWLGHLTMGLFTAHGLGYVIYWASTHQISLMLQWSKTHVSNVAGEISLAAGLILWAATFPGFRRRIFEVFFYTHHLYIVFVVFYVLHVRISGFAMFLPGFFLFTIDRYLRFLQSRSRVRVVSARVLPCDTVELTFSKTENLNYTPTSILFLNVPSISKLQWHPFTITSSSNHDPKELTVVVKKEGHWTSKLYELLSSPSSVDRLSVALEGPYGPASTTFLRHDILIMISGGSGITPFISLIRELMYSRHTLKQNIPKVLLIASFKNAADLAMLDLILPISSTSMEFPELQIEAYVTRENHPPPHKKTIHTIWFKPNPDDSPMASILGQNGWLLLGLIISSSFILYLLLIGFLTRYKIYPIDHNTGKIYPAYSMALLHMLFICISIVIVSSAAFLWAKRRNAKEATQVQHTGNSSPDIELESLPQQPLSQSINFHYGEKADLKKILFEQKELNNGVLVSGPRKMRYEVAKICSSGLAENLHFESISFTW